MGGPRLRHWHLRPDLSGLRRSAIVVAETMDDAAVAGHHGGAFPLPTPPGGRDPEGNALTGPGRGRLSLCRTARWRNPH